jgi:hypothetical protein
LPGVPGSLGFRDLVEVGWHIVATVFTRRTGRHGQRHRLPYVKVHRFNSMKTVRIREMYAGFWHAVCESYGGREMN